MKIPDFILALKGSILLLPLSISEQTWILESFLLLGMPDSFLVKMETEKDKAENVEMCQTDWVLHRGWPGIQKQSRKMTLGTLPRRYHHTLSSKSMQIYLALTLLSFSTLCLLISQFATRWF
jgi:hypothetical protein